jgi:hypothetical protein
MKNEMKGGLGLLLILGIILSSGLAMAMNAQYTKVPTVQQLDRIELFAELGQPMSFELGDEMYTLTLVGANSYTMEIFVAVGDDVRVLSEGETKIIGGVAVYAEDIFISTIGEGFVAAELTVTELNPNRR